MKPTITRHVRYRFVVHEDCHYTCDTCGLTEYGADSGPLRMAAHLKELHGVERLMSDAIILHDNGKLIEVGFV